MPLTRAHPVDESSSCWSLTSSTPHRSPTRYIPAFAWLSQARVPGLLLGCGRSAICLSPFTSDSDTVSHDLKGPLSVLQVNFEDVAALAS